MWIDRCMWADRHRQRAMDLFRSILRQTYELYMFQTHNADLNSSALTSTVERRNRTLREPVFLRQIPLQTKNGFSATLNSSFKRVQGKLWSSSLKRVDKNKGSLWIYCMLKSFTYTVAFMNIRGQGSMAKLNKIPHSTGLEHFISPWWNDTRVERWSLAENDSWGGEQPDLLRFLHYAFWKRNTLPLVPDERKLSVNILVWRLTPKVIDTCLSEMQEWGAIARLLTKCVTCQSKPAKTDLSHYAVDGNRAAVLPRAAFSPSPSHFAQMYFLSWGNWLANIQLIGWSPNPSHVNSKPISRSNVKSMYETTVFISQCVYCDSRRWASV